MTKDNNGQTQAQIKARLGRLNWGAGGGARRFRGRESIYRLNPAFGSIGWAVQAGKDSARTIRSIRSGGYQKAREYYLYYGDGRVAHGAAVRAVNTIAKIGNPKPYIVEDRTILALDFRKSMNARAPVYTPMKSCGKQK